MRLGFYGTPDTAVPYLEALAERHQVVAVVTQPDRPSGRSGRGQESPVKVAARRRGLEVLQPERGACDYACARVDALEAELCVVVAFGQRLPCGGRPCGAGQALNVHYSLLPKLRGAAPVQHAILQGLATTGVTIQRVGEGWDQGEIMLQQEAPVLPEDTAGTLFARLTDIGVPLLLQALEQIAAGTARFTLQDHGQATFAPLLKRTDGVVDWREPAELLARKVRAFDPWPGMTTATQGKPLKLLTVCAESFGGGQEGEPGVVVEVTPASAFAVACGQGRLRVSGVQPAGKKRMSAAEYLRGTPLQVGEKLGPPGEEGRRAD